MTPADLEATLRQAFGECEAMGLPLDLQQKQILLRSLLKGITDSDVPSEETDSKTVNPLDELTTEQRQALLQFIQTQAQAGRSWKVQLLNDWLHSRDSGQMQFIRQLYGLQWLERVKPIHIAQYADEVTLPLKVGDRIEVANSLWEWVQEEGPCSQEWFPCTVISMTEPLGALSPSAALGNGSYASCTIRFDNGIEYEIQGIYEWNRYNWRWASQKQLDSS